jgi:hypothetical protein|nr:MAG TPA: hypothetical protein [Caudoviricetes sp.]
MNAIELEIHNIKITEINNKIRRMLLNLKYNYDINIYTDKDENLNSIYHVIDLRNHQYDPAGELFISEIIDNSNVWSYLSEDIMGSNRKRNGNESYLINIFLDDKLYTYNFLMEWE